MRLAPLGVILWLVMMPLLCGLYLTVPVSPDQALFDYIAWSHLQGDYYYAGVAEQNWPGKMLMHELGIRIFGVHFWTFRAIDFALMQVVTVVGALFLYRAGFRTAFWVFLLVYPPLYVTAGYWMAGQRDIVAMGLLLAAATSFLSTDGDANRKPAAYLLSGALIFLVVSMRPTYLTFLAILMLVLLVLFLLGRLSFSRAFLNVIMLSVGFAAPLAVLIWLGHSIGALDDFYQQTILFNIEVYPVPQPRSRLFEPIMLLLVGSWHWITLLAAVGFVLWLVTAGTMLPLFLIVGLVATILISYFVQNKGFVYHLGGLLPLLCLFVAVTFDRALRYLQAAGSRQGRIISGGALIVAAALAVAGTGAKIKNTLPPSLGQQISQLSPNIRAANDLSWDQITEVVTFIETNTAPDDYVLQWGRDFSVPYLAQRRSTLRFVSTPALDILTPAFSGYDAWLSEIATDLVEKRPAVVIVPSAIVSGGTPPQAREDASIAEAMVIAHLADYEAVIQNEHIVVFKD